MELNTTIY